MLNAFNLPLTAATINGVVPALILESMSSSRDSSFSMISSFPPSASLYSTVNPLLFFNVRSDPVSKRMLNEFYLPLTAATINGVVPALLLESMSSPRDRSFSMISSFLPSAALCSTVIPLLFFKVGCDPLSKRKLNAFNLPLTAATINGVVPALLLESMSSPRDSSFSMISSFLPSAALCSTVKPLLFFKVGSDPCSTSS